MIEIPLLFKQMNSLVMHNLQIALLSVRLGSLHDVCRLLVRSAVNSVWQGDLGSGSRRAGMQLCRMPELGTGYPRH